MRTFMVLPVVSVAIAVSLATAEEPVYFADADLKAVVEDTLWISDPTPQDMLALTSLNATFQGIADLTGLEHAVNLQSLYLSHNKISDISPLSGLSQVETLHLNVNEIGDISALSGLTSLETLIIHRNPISDLSPLSGLCHLRTLDLRNTEIADISGLSGLSSLERLDLQFNRISDISALSGLGNLQELNLFSNLITDLSALSGLEAIRHLSLYHNEISDVSALSGLGNMEDLDLYGNQISDISPLSGLTRLESLNLHSNQISDISALSSLTELCNVDLSSNQISDISPLSLLTNLRTLDLDRNPLNEEACDIYVAQIIANNPGISFTYPPCECTLSISCTCGGSVTEPGVGEFTYEPGERVYLQADAAPGFVFAGWSGTHFTTQNPTYVTMNHDCQMHASFLSLLDVIYVDDDAPHDPGSGDSSVSDPLEDGTPEHPFDRIQEAIEVAAEGVSIIVRGGRYRENIELRGQNIDLCGIAPDATATAAYPVIVGDHAGPVVRFSGGADEDCLFTGFVVTGGRGGRAGALHCDGSSPMVANCLIVGNRATMPDGAAVYCTDSHAVFASCTVAHNAGGDYGAGIVSVNSAITVLDSIIWGNTPSQIVTTGETEPSITYTDVEGWWPDWGNLHDDPLFARHGYWAQANAPDIAVAPDTSDAIWMDGDYHLKSQAGRWDPEMMTWVQDAITSPCVDAGDRTSPVGEEPSPNGHVVNMGAYGGTAQASKSPGQ